MTTRKALGVVGTFLHQVKEGGKRRLDIAGYDAKALENRIAEQENADNEHWHRVNRLVALDQEGKLK